METITPALEFLLLKFDPASVDRQESTPAEQMASGKKSNMAGGISGDFNVIKFAFSRFLKALATPTSPVVLFIDDLQWADSASVQLLTYTLKDTSLKNVMFIGAYRSNEVDEDHSFAKMKTELRESLAPPSSSLEWSDSDAKVVPASSPVQEIQLSNLSPDHVAELIADCLEKDARDMAIVTEAVYTKTLGNVFFVKQALEALVRKNAIYYDVMTFEWQVVENVSKIELQKNYLSNDVVSMVQSKLETLPPTLQLALSVAAYTKNAVTLKLLLSLLKPKEALILEQNHDELSLNLLEKLMKLALMEGLVLYEKASSVENKSFKFAHDRIREAACEAIPIGAERDQFLLDIANVLLELSEDSEKKDEDWMMFTAVRHLNAIPDKMTDAVDVATLNLKVGKLAVSKGAFDDALVFFKAAKGRLNMQRAWTEQYDLTLELHNSTAESESALGNHENAMNEASEIFQKARSLPDKVRAQSTYIESLCELNKEDYDVWTTKAVEILSLHDIDLPASPSYAQLRNEVIKFMIALRGRSIFCLTKFPIATVDDKEAVVSSITIANVVLRRAVVNTRMFLAGMLAYRILRIALTQKIVTKDLFTVVWSLTFTFRKQEKYNSAFAYSTVGSILRDRFPEENGKEYIVPRVAPIAVSSYQVPYRNTIEPWLELHKLLMARGMIEVGLACAMFAIYAHFCASLPLNTLLESKLILFEEMSRDLGRDMFMELFLLLRQCLYNLHGHQRASSRPLELDGPVFSETRALENFEGAALKSITRDIGVIRLQLAVIYDDQDVMEEMINKLDVIPAYDNLVGRQHVRLTYTGIAALLSKNRNKPTNQKWAAKAMGFFEKLTKLDSPNAKPVHACLQALDKPSIEAFDAAIEACRDADLANLGALMNERCGMWLMKRHVTGEKENERSGCSLWLPHADNRNDSSWVDPNMYTDYLKGALILYHSWGAKGKVSQLEERYSFLRGAIKR